MRWLRGVCVGEARPALHVTAWTCDFGAVLSAQRLASPAVTFPGVLTPVPHRVCLPALPRAWPTAAPRRSAGSLQSLTPPSVRCLCSARTFCTVQLIIS